MLSHWLYFIKPPRKAGTKQTRVIFNCNLLIDALEREGIDLKLSKLSPKGECYGMTVNYTMYAYRGQRREYILTLMFLGVLTRNEIDDVAKHYRKAIDTGTNLYAKVSDNDEIEYRFIIDVLKNIYDLQQDQIRSLCPREMLWDKNYSFICARKQLSGYLRDLTLKDHDSVTLHSGNHSFTFEKAWNGYYLFESNEIDDKAIYSEFIKDEVILARVIIDHLYFDLCACGIYCMPKPSDSFYKDSDESHLFLYRDDRGVYYQIKDSGEIFLNEDYRVLKALKPSFFKQHDIRNPQKTNLDKNLHRAILKTTYKRHHTHFLSDNIGFAVQFTSYASQSYIHPENAELDYFFHQTITSHGYLPNEEIRNIIHDYVNRKISRLDSALVINAILENENKHDSEFISFKNKIANYLSNQTQFIKHQLSYNINDINQTAYGREITLLFLATQLNQIQLVKYLIDDGAGDGKMHFLYDALYIACCYGLKNILPLLFIRSMSKDDLLDYHHPQKLSPLHAASACGHRSAVEILIANMHQPLMLDIEIVIESSILLNQIAKCKRQDEFQQLLLAKGRKKLPDIISEFTPLHIAICFNQSDIVQVLLEHGADANKAISGISTIEFAQAMGNNEILKILTSHSPKLTTNYTIRRGI